MTNHLPDTFSKHLDALKRALRMSTSEAHEMRGRLIAYAEMHAVNAGAPETRRADVRAIPSPYAHYVAFASFFRSRAFVAGALILILILGAGTDVTYAAGSALPGQPLYPIKVDIAEPIQGAVIAATSGTQGTGEWQNTLAERRITEAATLVAEGKLASSTQAYLETEASLHVAQSEDDSAQLAAAGNTTAANDVRADLAARLAAHARLLALIAPRVAAEGNATTTNQVVTLLNTVNQEQDSVLFSRESGEAASSTASSSSPSNASTTPFSSVATTSSDFKNREQQFFDRDLHILSFLSSTTASTSLPEFKKHKEGNNDATTTSEASSADSVKETTAPDFPAFGTSENTTSPELDL